MADTDGSETLNLTFTNVPAGATMSDGTNTYTPIDGNITMDGVNPDNISSITLNPPSEFSGQIELGVEAVSVDTNGVTTDILDSAETAILTVDVAAVASGFNGDGINATISDYTPTADGISVDVDVTGINVVDSDGSESLTLSIKGLGDSAEVTYLDNGESIEVAKDSNGNFAITMDPSSDDYASIMQNITITATNADDLEGDIKFDATVTESSNGSSTTISDSVSVADFVIDETLGGDTQEDTRSINKDILFDLNATLPDTGSDNEKLGTIEIGLPDGAELNYANGNTVATSNGVASISIVIVDDSGQIDESIHGANQSVDGLITMTQSEFDTLQITPPDNFSGEMNIDTTFSAFEVDNSNNIIEGIDGVSTTNSESITVENIIEGTDADDVIIGTETGETIDAGAGNDILSFDVNDTIDGEEGLDTLVLEGDMENIDFSGFSDNISNIETIDLGKGSQNISLDIQDVLDMTDDTNNLLRIDGDSSDSIDLDTDNSNEWILGDFQTTDELTGQTYDTYTSGEGDATVTLEISTDIQISES